MLPGIGFSYRAHRLRRRRLYRRLILMTPKLTIGILGGGLMGAGIAHVFAAAGHRVRVFEPLSEARASLRTRVRTALASFHQDEALADQVTPCDDLGDTVSQAEYVT